MTCGQPIPDHVFSVSELERLPEISLVYRRLPSRVSRVPTRVLHIDAERAIWINRLSPSKPLTYEGRQVMGKGYWAAWFVWNGRPFDLGKCYDTDLRHTGYYVDVLEPVRWQSSAPHQLDPLTDLFLDLWITPDGLWRVLDEDEFEEAKANGWMTVEQASHATSSLDTLVSLLRSGEFLPEDVATFSLVP